MFKIKHFLEDITFKTDKNTTIYRLNQIIDAEEVKEFLKDDVLQQLFLKEIIDTFVIKKGDEYLVKTMIKKRYDIEDSYKPYYEENYEVTYKPKAGVILVYEDNEMLIIHTKEKKDILLLKRQPEKFNVFKEKVIKKENKFLEKDFVPNYKKPYDKYKFSLEDGFICTNIYLGQKYKTSDVDKMIHFYTAYFKYKYPSSLIEVHFEVKEFDVFLQEDKKEYALRMNVQVKTDKNNVVTISSVKKLFKTIYTITSDIRVQYRKNEIVLIGEDGDKDSFYLFLTLENNIIKNTSSIGAELPHNEREFKIFVGKEFKGDEK